MENGFKTCGLWPIDDDIFTEDDFAASMLTEEPNPAVLCDQGAGSTPHGRMGSSTGKPTSSTQPDGGAHPETSSGQPGGGAHPGTSSGQPGDEAQSSSSGLKSDTILDELCQTPKAQRRTRSRRAERSVVLTSSPCKAELRARQKTKHVHCSSPREKPTSGVKRKGKGSGEKKKETKKRKHGLDRSSPRTEAGCSSSDCTRCYVCSMRHDLSCEEWIKCNVCHRWACLPCTDADANQVSFICDMCR